MTVVPNGSMSSLAPVSLNKVRTLQQEGEALELATDSLHSPLTLPRYTDAESGSLAMSPSAWNALTLPNFPPPSFASPKSTRLYV